MGGDLGPQPIVSAVLKELSKDPNLAFIVVGDQGQIKPLLSSFQNDTRLRIVHTTDVVTMTDKPASVIRNKTQSSMRLAVELLRSGEAQACISAGNTGALMALGYYLLKTLPGIDRPAIVSSIPNAAGRSYLLDLGANVDCSSEQLLQFAVMGSVLCQAVDGIGSPRVGLLNVGSESGKGNERVKLAAQLLQENSAINYVGFVEGGGIFDNSADVIVCDGFVGNVALKASEGVSSLLAQMLEAQFQQHWSGRILRPLVRPILKKWQRQIEPARYNGASLLGLQRILIKSHGDADGLAFKHAIRLAKQEIQKDVPALINQRLDQIFSE